MLESTKTDIALIHAKLSKVLLPREAPTLGPTKFDEWLRVAEAATASDGLVRSIQLGILEPRQGRAEIATLLDDESFATGIHTLAMKLEHCSNDSQICEAVNSSRMVVQSMSFILDVLLGLPPAG